MDTDILQKVDAQRLELESNIARLRKALHHWTALELDYEGLKDEFWMLEAGATKEDCLKAARSFSPQKVDEKELNELIEPSRGKVRSPLQLVEVLSKRIEYVLRNADSLKKQISESETKRNALLLAAHPEHEAEASLPITEITEELDDDGNIVSSSLQKQGDTAKKVLDVLSKTAEGHIRPKTSPTISAPRIEEINDSEEENPALRTRPDDEAHLTHNEKPLNQDQSQYATNPEDTEEEAEMRREMIHYGLGEVGNIVAELQMDDADHEASEEDEEMRDYFNEDENEDGDDYDDEFSDDESEDESGRASAAIHKEKYKKQMEELEKQTGFRMENLGPSPASDLTSKYGEQVEHLRDHEFKDHIQHLPPEFRKRFMRPTPAEAARKAAIAREEANRHSSRGNGEDKQGGTKVDSRSNKKKVTFAPALDIAPDSLESKSTTMSDTVAEKELTDDIPALPSQPKSVSRFRSARSVKSEQSLLPPPMEVAQPQRNKPEGPVGRTVAQELVERQSTTSSDDAPPPDSDDFDEELQMRQIAVEHHRLHNRIVHEKGGYVRGGENENWGDEYAAPVIQDTKTGEPVKISRFKAARMKPQ